MEDSAPKKSTKRFVALTAVGIPLALLAVWLIGLGIAQLTGALSFVALCIAWGLVYVAGFALALWRSTPLAAVIGTGLAILIGPLVLLAAFMITIIWSMGS